MPRIKKTTRVCVGCKKELPLTTEYFKETDLGYLYRCIPCLREYNRIMQRKSRARKKGATNDNG